METKFEDINTEKQIHWVETSREMMNHVQESDYHTKENNKTFVCESCKTNEMLSIWVEIIPHSGKRSIKGL